MSKVNKKSIILVVFVFIFGLFLSLPVYAFNNIYDYGYPYGGRLNQRPFYPRGSFQVNTGMNFIPSNPNYGYPYNGTLNQGSFYPRGSFQVGTGVGFIPNRP